MSKETDVTWKPVVGYEGMYEVSNTGLVRGLDRYVVHCNGVHQFVKGIMLNQKTTYDGYKEVTLQKQHKPKCIRVHRLVAFAFLGNPPNEKMEVNHIDGNKVNNNVSNLEWVTSSENQKHAYQMGLQKVSGNAVSGKKDIICITLNHYEHGYASMMRYLYSTGYCKSPKLSRLSILANRFTTFYYRGLLFSTDRKDMPWNQKEKKLM